MPETPHNAVQLRSRNHLRAAVLPQLIPLAADAISAGRKLIARIEYYRHTSDDATLRMQGKAGAFH